jgi:hypothetical protein
MLVAILGAIHSGNPVIMRVACEARVRYERSVVECGGR